MAVLVEHDGEGNILSVALVSEELPAGVSVSRRVEKGAHVIQTDLPVNIERTNWDEIRRLNETHRVDIGSGKLIPKK